MILKQTPQILVIEDDEAYASWLKDNLSAEGFQIEAALSAEEGFRFSRKDITTWWLPISKCRAQVE